MAAGRGSKDEAILAGMPPVAIRIRRSAQARRISLRVSALDGRVTLSLPERARLAEGMAFVRDREGWIREALTRQPPVTIIAPGVAMPVEGEMRILTEARVPRVTLMPGAVLGPPGARFPTRLTAFLKALARERLEAACLRHAISVQRQVAAIALRDTRSRWGSCTADGRLMFSWRLILAPPEVLDYVAAHEVAHLVHMDHSPAFWGVVARLCPDHARHRRWLREQGAALHAWRV